MKTFSVLLGIAAGALAPLALVSPADAVGETCNGLAATLVGTSGSTVTGTEGPDVIVTAGATEVRGNGGDDTICTTLSGPAPLGTLVSVRVLAGPGNDYVDRTGDTEPLAVGLVSGDAGQDTILGAPGADLFNVNDGEHDTVSTFGGNDSGTDGGDPGAAADADTIDLGPGDDSFSAEGPFTSTGPSVLGGEGTDSIFWSLPRSGRFIVDAAAGQFRGPAGIGTVFGGIEGFSASSLKTASWSFNGSDAGEFVQGSTRELAKVSLGGGDDRLVFAVGRKRHRVNVDAGAGHDAITLYAQDSKVTVDLGRGRYAVPQGDHGRLASFDDATVNALQPLVTGTSAPNVLDVVSCVRGHVDGAGGDDELTVARRPKRRCNPGAGFHVYGGGGNDVIKGSRVADLIVGGPGHDTADGAGGRDTCRSIEAATRCE